MLNLYKRYVRTANKLSMTIFGVKPRLRCDESGKLTYHLKKEVTSWPHYIVGTVVYALFCFAILGAAGEVAKLLGKKS